VTRAAASRARGALLERFVAAEQVLEKQAERSPRAAGAGVAEAWLTLVALRGEAPWLGAAAAAAEAALRRDGGAHGTEGLPLDERADWLMLACEGWVRRAAGPFRALADRLADRIPDDLRAVAPLQRYWRISGRSRWRERLLGIAADARNGGGAASLATADDGWLADARRAVGGLDPDACPVADWPLLAELRGLGVEDFGAAMASWPATEPGPSAADVVRAGAALLLPELRLRVQWWIAAELAEGPVSEALTFPWPSLRVQFERLPDLDQVRIVPSLAGRELPVIEDVGVVASALGRIVEGAAGLPRRGRD
jgi:hypothetical protein